MATFLSGTSFITGAGSGIGQAAAYALAQRGSCKIAVADIDVDSLDITTAELKARHPNIEVLSLELDVASESSVSEAIQRTVEVFGRIDIAVNNAGIVGPRGPSADVKFDDWKKLIDINLHGVWLCGRAEIKQMLQQEPLGIREGRGTIINIASMYGLVGIWSELPATAYSASKYAVVGITKTEANLVADQGIRINALCPGFIETPLIMAAIVSGAMDNEIAQTPMKRLGRAEEIADCIAFLASPMSSFMTGSTMVVDGGYTSK